MINGYAAPEQYTEMIRALQKFNQEIATACDSMTNAGKICMSAMGSDALSANSVAKLAESVKKYHAVMMKSTELQKKLSREREAVIELIKQSKKEG